MSSMQRLTKPVVAVRIHSEHRDRVIKLLLREVKGRWRHKLSLGRASRICSLAVSAPLSSTLKLVDAVYFPTPLIHPCLGLVDDHTLVLLLTTFHRPPFAPRKNLFFLHFFFALSQTPTRTRSTHLGCSHLILPPQRRAQSLACARASAAPCRLTTTSRGH
jgi:hypothetical protein